MKKLLFIISIFLVSCFSSNAENLMRERVYIHTDKDCYIAGEDIWLKFYLINSDFKPSALSKVGYIEICDTEKPHIQLKVALENGSGAGKVKIPVDIPSGIYRLSGYTRFMRNEGENVFFHKQLAIINAGQQTFDPKRMELKENYENIQPAEIEHSGEKQPANLLVFTDRNEYGNRMKVDLSLDNIPENTAGLVVSVSRNDSITIVQQINKEDWKKQVKETLLFSQRWLPEYEGHIINGAFTPKLQENQLRSTISIAGKDIRYFNGKINYQNETVDFYTGAIYGKQQVVTSVISILYDKVPFRLDLKTPFCESLPVNLPVLQIYPNERRLIERYIGAQIKKNSDNDSIIFPVQPSGYFSFQPIFSYDLDEYTRFNSIGETILEFINRVHVARVEGKRKIKVFSDEENRFNYGNTLVLFDGVPIYDHEEILRYNPMHIKKINVYDGKYLFGGEDIECIVSFITYEGNLPFFQLSEGSQLFNYEFPQLPSKFEIPDYSNELTLNSKKPDFRHTLYWNPLVEYTHGLPVNLSFFTSDLEGEFKIIVEGFTAEGEMLHGVSYFKVVKPNK